MYGLMKARACSHHPQEARNRRLHYCGTCKTMGRLYGQKARLLLNNDAVFLGELLTALAPGPPALDAWNRAYHSYNCFALPDTPEEMPLSLQVAATATLVMSEFKVADQIADASHGGWKLALRVFSQSFTDAAARMKAWGFPVAAMWEWYRAQNARETEIRETKGSRSAQEVLAYVAEPTATVTGLVFQHGGALIGCAPETQTTLYALGFAFGKLVYVLDALEDYEQDAKRGDFNALRVAFGLDGETLPDAYDAMTVDGLQQIAAQIEAELNALPLPRAQAAKFAARLRANLIRKIGVPVDAEEPTETTTCAISPARSRLPFHPLNLMSWGALLQSLRPQRLQPTYRLASAGGSGSGTVLQSNGTPVDKGIPRSQSRRMRRASGERVGGCCCADMDCCDACCLVEQCGECSCCACEGCECCSGACDCCSSCS